ncbi:hypothetical protein CFC21_090416 [Triticum aestivum]|uniref:Uncharacterized protein n=2 Tax=Triticum aestivum TaxID=4565 RepID=A0A3B6PVL4_WHEAT|nr:hypothetical protein CFC21_090416 [Triticum aestivum]
MEGIFSATFGELISRCISFLINKYSTKISLSKGEILQQLDRMLLRVLLITVEEAEGRSITNQAMLRQLNMLRQDMCRGYYLLDKFRYLAHEEGKAKDLEASHHSFALCISNPGKRASLSASSTHGEKELRKMLETIENVVTSMHEFVAFLNNYPPICRRQPYNMHLVMETCMFGRQVEVQRIISFLLRHEPPGEHSLGVGVLPIVGPGKVGKSTLVEHVCCDVRVRDHFTQIVLVCENKFIQGELRTLRDGGIIKHQNQNGIPSEEKIIVVIELNGEVDEGVWRKLYSASTSFIPRGSKIIITSRAENITRFGNTQALWLNFLPREESWYFFKVLVFGSADPEDHPKLASIAMEIFEGYFGLEMFNDYTGPFTNPKLILGF